MNIVNAYLRKGRAKNKKNLIILEDGIIKTNIFREGFALNNYKVITSYTNTDYTLTSNKIVASVQDTSYWRPVVLQDGDWKSTSQNFLSTVYWAMPIKRYNFKCKYLCLTFHFTYVFPGPGGQLPYNLAGIRAVELDDNGGLLRDIEQSEVYTSQSETNVSHTFKVDITAFNHLDYITLMYCDGTIVFDKIWLEADNSFNLPLTDSNGVFYSTILINNLSPADMNINTWNSNKYKQTSWSDDGASVQNLSQYFLTDNMLCAMATKANHLYQTGEYWTNNQTFTTQSHGEIYIPVKRLFGYKTIIYKAKSRGGASDPYPRICMGAAAVVNGSIQRVRGIMYYYTADWTEYNADISSLPYIDYISFYFDSNPSAYKEILLEG